jgi:hypothetical protein
MGAYAPAKRTPKSRYDAETQRLVLCAVEGRSPCVGVQSSENIAKFVAKRAEVWTFMERNGLGWNDARHNAYRNRWRFMRRSK